MSVREAALLSEGFLDNYPSHPEHMSPLGLFTFYRTYSRFLPEEKRRETWKETCARAVNYNVGLERAHRAKTALPENEAWLRKEAEELFDSMFNLRQFVSGRSLWIAGTRVAEDYPMANFNCSFTNIERWEDLAELFYLLMLGSGVGFKSTPQLAAGMAPIRTNVHLILSEYRPVEVDYRLEHTDTRYLENGFAKIYVGDSKEGWRDALLSYFHLLTRPEYEHIHTIKISFNSVRPKGERLKTFGGTASGPEPLKEMFAGFDAALKNKIDPTLAPIIADSKGYGRVRPIHILDMGNLIGANVVAGGVRRTAEIALFDAGDLEFLFAKYAINGFWNEEHFRQHERVKAQLQLLNIPLPGWFDAVGERHYDEQVNGDRPFNYGRAGIGHRRLSNNSIVFNEKPIDAFLHLVFLMIQLDGEPGFINMEEMGRRRENAQGINPCAEILLDNKQQCNLTTINLAAFAKETGFDEEGAQKAQELSARAGVRMTLVDLELPRWDFIHKRDRLTGCSLTGVADAIGAWPQEKQEELLKKLARSAREAAATYAAKLRVQSPLLVTTVKPEGTLSLVAGGVSPGLHDAHSPYFIRRIRISSDDALAKAALVHGWQIHPEVGTKDNKIENARTLVIDFPVKSGALRTKDDVSALEQLERYLMFQGSYTDHNSSNTITVRPEEWEGLEQAIIKAWDDFAGVSFLALDGGTYQLAPYEAITREEYEALQGLGMPFDPRILQFYEGLGVSDLDEDDPDCATGGCPTR